MVNPNSYKTLGLGVVYTATAGSALGWRWRMGDGDWGWCIDDLGGDRYTGNAR
jgi:hypothetical protein